MPALWTLEKSSALEKSKLEQLRQNALARSETALVEMCEQVQNARKKSGVTTEPVIGFHFVCKDDYEVELEADGAFWSGVWATDEAHCDTAIRLKGYLALHETKKELSYRQGTIIGWRREERTKGTKPLGVSFLVRPFETPQSWFGHGAGEKGYRRIADQPRWIPPSDT